MRRGDGVVERAVPGGPGPRVVRRQVQAVHHGLGDRHVPGVHHARHAVAHHVQVLELTPHEGGGVEGGRVAGREPVGDAQLGVGLQDVVLLDEGLLGQFPN